MALFVIFGGAGLGITATGWPSASIDCGIGAGAFICYFPSRLLTSGKKVAGAAAGTLPGAARAGMVSHDPDRGYV